MDNNVVAKILRGVSFFLSDEQELKTARKFAGLKKRFPNLLDSRIAGKKASAKALKISSKDLETPKEEKKEEEKDGNRRFPSENLKIPLSIPAIPKKLKHGIIVLEKNFSSTPYIHTESEKTSDNEKILFDWQLTRNRRFYLHPSSSAKITLAQGQALKKIFPNFILPTN